MPAKNKLTGHDEVGMEKEEELLELGSDDLIPNGCFLYHAKDGAKVFRSKKEVRSALLSGWADSPAKLKK